MRSFVLAAAVIVATTSAANAYCRAPARAPEPPKSYDRPEMPSCMKLAGDREVNCDRYELDRYSRDVADYIRKLEDFVYEAERYAAAADQYAQCEADAARDSLTD